MWFAPPLFRKLGTGCAHQARLFWPEGIAIPPVHPRTKPRGGAFSVDTIIEKFRPQSYLHFSADDVQKRFDRFLGEPVTVGFVDGLVIAYRQATTKAVPATGGQTAAVMLLMPRVIKPIMDGLTPIAKHARKRLQAKFMGRSSDRP